MGHLDWRETGKGGARLACIPSYLQLHLPALLPPGSLAPAVTAYPLSTLRSNSPERHGICEAGQEAGRKTWINLIKFGY